MTSFIWLFLSHLCGDWLIQTEFQALNKAKGAFFNRALFAHCLGYTVCFVPIFLLTGASWWWMTLSPRTTPFRLPR